MSQFEIGTVTNRCAMEHDVVASVSARSVRGMAHACALSGNNFVDKCGRIEKVDFNKKLALKFS